MYNYNDFDAEFVGARTEEFATQIEDRINGTLSEAEFKPFRLQNGLYLQLHAYMLRVAVPYGTLNALKMRQLAHIAETYDKGYGHFTTRQNIQFNWPKLPDIPAILRDLAEVEMHAIQTSGNCIRNVTADHFAGAIEGEVEDPRITAEILRQWSTGHPEFAFLPRKFKFAVTGHENDRAVLHGHDIGVQAVRKGDEVGYKVLVGGGLGRTPLPGKVVNEFVTRDDLLPYLDAMLSVYNRYGRRDNKYKARIKILVLEKGIDWYRDAVEAQFAKTKARFAPLDAALVADIRAAFELPDLGPVKNVPMPEATGAFASFIDTNLHPHKHADYRIVSISLKPIGGTPGDASADQMRAVADLAEKYGVDEIRVSHEQNLILPHVHVNDLEAVYEGLRDVGLATANIGLVSDMIACPGMDYCALATARSIPIAQEISEFFDARAQEIGDIKIKISGCINACGHHHVGHIGILGLDRAGVENYQVTLGGDGTETFSIGERVGPGFSADDLVPALDRLMTKYLEIRETPDERFIDTYRRVGAQPFKDAAYPEKAKENAA